MRNNPSGMHDQTPTIYFQIHLFSILFSDLLLCEGLFLKPMKLREYVLYSLLLIFQHIETAYRTAFLKNLVDKHIQNSEKFNFFLRKCASIF